ncbi:hypothetical protein I552_1430 [Mycobacterium xenopi 3993]|nr:hypothetical protein I552_1430 [Mycobacterium xenopi 3993]
MPALVAAGAEVVCTDIDAAAAARTADNATGPEPPARPRST